MSREDPACLAFGPYLEPQVGPQMLGAPQASREDGVDRNWAPLAAACLVHPSAAFPEHLEAAFLVRPDAACPLVLAVMACQAASCQACLEGG